MKRKKVISWITVILWVAVIYSLSAQPAASSNQLSKCVTEILVEMIKKVTAINLEVNDLNHFVRKNAYFIAYLILGGLVSNALKYCGSGLNKSFLAGLICVGYAISDEIHQIFVPGRGPQIKEVLIDSGGAAVGIFIWLVASIRRSDLRARKSVRELGWTGAVGEKH